MRKNKRKVYTLLIVLLLMFVSIGYAALSSTLNITGASTINNPTWDIHWENVAITPGSVAASTPTIDASKTTVTYSVNLVTPGDFYEFTVDAVNAGTIDGMIQTIVNKMNGSVITTLPNYLNYEVTYADGVAISQNHLLSANSSEKYRIRVEYKRDINPEDIPDDNQTLTFNFSVVYVQADNNSIPKPDPPIYYTVSITFNYIGSPLPSVATYTNYNDAVTAFGHPFFLRHMLDSNNNIASSYIGFVLNDNVYYLQGAGATYDSTNNKWNNDSIYYATNKATLINAFGNENCTETTTPDYIYCTLSGLSVDVNGDGSVVASDVQYSGCYVHPGGISSCRSGSE